ncbi:MAG: CapA family protein, partial [Erysipelotrichaceae bacterium]|nr:CapA family protein [Erysipelotrichaceae bacterium]
MKYRKRKIRPGRLGLVVAVPLVLAAASCSLLSSAHQSRHKNADAAQQTQTAVPAAGKSSDNTVKITATGDILMEDAILNYFGSGDWKGYMDALVPVFEQDDLTIANQEVPIGGESLGITGIDFSFNSPDITADNVKAQGIDFVTLANNHAVDRGYDGIVNTIDNLNRAGVDSTGAYKSEEDASTLKTITVNGIKIGIVSWTYSTNQPIEYPWSVNVFTGSEQELLDQVQKLDEQCDAVIAAMHWGTEFTYDLSNEQQVLAQQLADAGADVIIGNHPHTVQPAAWLDGKDGKVLCFYSLGNLVSSAYTVSRASEQFQNMYEVGALGQFTLKKTGDKTTVEDVSIIPFVNQFSDEYQNFR